MTTTDLINGVREQAIQHERALHVIRPWLEQVESLLSLSEFKTTNFCGYPHIETALRVFPKAREQYSKDQVLAALVPVLDGWRAETDTGHAWLNLYGSVDGHSFCVTIYTQEKT